MKFPSSLSRWPAIAVLWLPFAIGCASPGPPEPPSLHLPRTVADLSAQRVGNAVVLRWTTPSRTTDDLAIKGPITAEICREVRSSQRGSACVPAGRFAVSPGATRIVSPLPVALTGNPPALLRYRVRLFNAHDRTAGPSPAVYAASGAAPPPVQQLRASVARRGILLQWTPGPAFAVDLDRVLVPKPATAPSKPAKNASATPSRRRDHLTPATPVEVHLQAGGSSSDPGGTLDRNAQEHETYRYTAQRVRNVVLGGHALVLRSEPSPAVTITLTDAFPPDTPTGLAAIPGIHSIDLSWNPDSDNDLAGYVVYRQTAAPDGASAGPAERLNTAPLAGPAFSDRTASPGQSYLYRVTAIDAAGNESAPSAAVEQTLPEP